MKFSIKSYSEVSQQEVLSFLETARDFFHFIKTVDNNEKQKTMVGVWMLEDSIQKTETVTCGPFQIYCYDNLSFPDKNSKIHSFKKLKKSL